MFRILCDPSSGSTEPYLTEITGSGSQIFIVCFFFKDLFIALSCTNVYMNFAIKTVPHTSQFT
jgi:hypothetical protein